VPIAGSKIVCRVRRARFANRSGLTAELTFHGNFASEITPPGVREAGCTAKWRKARLNEAAGAADAAVVVGTGFS
jgi:hypothetical protein